MVHARHSNRGLQFTTEMQEQRGSVAKHLCERIAAGDLVEDSPATLAFLAALLGPIFAPGNGRCWGRMVSDEALAGRAGR